MAKAECKTRPNDSGVEAFLNAVEDERQRADSFRVFELMRRVTGEEPRMWGTAIIGFGSQYLKYASGREMDWPLIAFSPRKGTLTLYITLGGFKRYDPLMAKLGKHKTTKSCLYIKRLSDVDENVLEDLVSASLDHIKNKP